MSDHCEITQDPENFYVKCDKPRLEARIAELETALVEAGRWQATLILERDEARRQRDGQVGTRGGRR